VHQRLLLAARQVAKHLAYKRGTSQVGGGVGAQGVVVHTSEATLEAPGLERRGFCLSVPLRLRVG
jgi:hypothetical protein